jgi:hypothetical protein
MATKNVKLNDTLQKWFNTRPVAVPQHLTNRIRILRRLAGFLPQAYNREELNDIADELEDIRAVLTAISDQLQKGEDS